MEMLDNALNNFYRKAPPTISSCGEFGKKGKKYRIGVLGFSFFSSTKNIPFESDEAAKIK